MSSENHTLWEQLLTDLNLLAHCTCTEVLPFLIKAEKMLAQSADDTSLRTVSFMTHEIREKTQHHNTTERMHVLIDYFFGERAFSTFIPDGYQVTWESVSVPCVIQQKQGHSLVVSLIFLHLAAHLDLQVSIVDLPLHNIIKWKHDNGQTHFIDLAQCGHILKDEDVLKIFNHDLERRGAEPTHNTSLLDSISARGLIQCYFKLVLTTCSREQDLKQRHKILCALLAMEPESLGLLAERALLRRQLGMVKEAMADLKRYFSFTSRKTAPPEIKMAYYELNAINEASRQMPEILH